MDHWVGQAMIRFVKVPVYATVFNPSFYHQITQHTSVIIQTYLSFLVAVNSLSNSYKFYNGSFLIEHSIDGYKIDPQNIIIPSALDQIHQEAKISLNSYPKNSGKLIPIHVHFNDEAELHLATGINVVSSETLSSKSIVHILSLPSSILDYENFHLWYIQEMMDDYIKNPKQSLTALCAKFNKSYRQLQKDSKAYYGTTFYNFYIQLKMMDVIEEIMFSGFSLKEIAYRNNFSDYSSMYRLFSSYNFPIKNIKRFL
ncbi:helix-turn-helix domain-containing protein [Elizabethkingia anophelis]|uniref:helix-turn-helix domain-containing protein n=1 Tax=Elizabethkingia anophelis TaxID=1117645 RepID=UPI001371D13F|nr:helix-turn-helix domain-containing protein [Elizabethkingia anophelis]